MGEWDFYCFLCATAFSPESATIDSVADDESTSENTHDIQLTPENLAWLSTFRVIAENQAAAGQRRCYLSGHGEETGFGHADVAKGADPIAPGDGRDDRVDTGMYRDFDADDEVGALPVHDCCLRVLERAAVLGGLVGGGTGAFEKADKGFGFALGGVGGVEGGQTNDGEEIVGSRPAETGMDIDAFFHSLSPKREEYRCSLTIDYGAMNDMASEQYFYLEKGMEPYVLNPYNIPQMDSLIKALPLLSFTSVNSSEPPIDADHPVSTTKDPFSNLSLELLTTIYLNLPQASLPQALLSSRSLNRVRTYNWFWLQRIKLDMPWAWEVLDLNHNTDFHQAYIQLANLVKDPLNSRIPALANRKRVWYACEQVLELYSEYLVKNLPPEVEFENVSEAVRKGARLERFSLVATSKESSKIVTTIWFPLSEENIQSEKKLVMYWKHGSLAGLACVVGTQSTTIGNTIDTDEPHETAIGKDDWISSLTFHIVTVETKIGEKAHQVARNSLVVGVTIKLLSSIELTLGKIDGDKRLFMPQQGKAIVGLKVELAGSIITRFGLLEYAHSGINQLQELGDPVLLTHLWANHVPKSPGLVFEKSEIGYWGMTRHQDLVPFKCLMFGMDTKEQGVDRPSCLTGISGSYDARSWTLHRRVGDRGFTESVGPDQGDSQMRFFPIDGNNGECIIGVETDIGACITGVRILTNKQRQCIWGKTDNAKLQYHAEAGRYIAGICCSHGYTSAQTQLTTFSIITAANSAFSPSQPIPDFTALKDLHGLPWEPSSPPPNYTEMTPIYHGSSAQGERATLLDFSRHITRITGLLAAAPDTLVGNLGGFSIVYADGGVVFCGATSPMQDAHENNPMGSSVTGLVLNQKELMSREIPHVESEEEARAQPAIFEIGGGGEKIKMVKVWAAAYLHGIQFVTESGRESPRWGKCGGSAAVMVMATEFVESVEQVATVSGGVDGSQNESETMRVVGLKIILGSRRYNSGYADVRPLAVQVMGVSREREAVA